MPNSANIVLHAYRGDRCIFPSGQAWSAVARDGRSESSSLPFPALTCGSQILTVPFFDNFGDLYTVVANADGYDGAAWYPVHVNDKIPVTLDLMLLPHDGILQFANASWTALCASRPGVAAIVRRGCESDDDAAAKFSRAIEVRPQAIACFLNLATALAQIRLPSGKSPLDYYWNAAWPRGDAASDAWLKAFDNVMKPDRLFAYVDEALLPDVQAAAGRGFAEEKNPQAWGHTGATESYKETQFDVGNVQLTFLGHDRATFTDESGPHTCVKVEPDIDYYKDIAAHGLFEVLPGLFPHHLTDPRMAFALRWMASKQEGRPEFNPLFTVEPRNAPAEPKALPDPAPLPAGTRKRPTTRPRGGPRRKEGGGR